MRKHLTLSLLALLVTAVPMFAEKVTMSVTMNATSRTMQLVPFHGKDAIEIGEPTSYKYTFEAEPGRYILTAYNSSGYRNGTLVVDLKEGSNLNVYTVTTKATNKDWVLGKDYTVKTNVTDGASVQRDYIEGVDKVDQTAVTFLALRGDNYSVSLIPNAQHEAEGYLAYNESNPITANKTVSKVIPQGHSFVLTAPKGADVFVGSKIRHFVPFEAVEPIAVEESDNSIAYTYVLAENTDYSYRITKEGLVTTAAKFKMPTTDHAITVTEDDMQGDPKMIDRDPLSNNKYNVADVFVNADHTGSININSGSTFQIVNLRNWEIVDNTSNNYFIEPDYHYTVLDDTGKPSTSVVEVSADGVIKAKSAGTAVVLVTYDAINAPGQLGGPLFSAIWPENTGVIVVNVDKDDCGVVMNTTLNGELNTSNADRVAGQNIDAELDVIYFTGEKGEYTFTPEGATKVQVANAKFTDDVMGFGRFLPSNATKNSDGSYTVSLVDGKNIVRVGNSNGYSYQVIRAKKVKYTIVNTTHDGEDPNPGDVLKITFDGIYHPCNKLAGVYNMSAQIRYTDAAGNIILGGKNQYQFASNDAARTLTVTIPEDWDVTVPYTLTDGVLMASGYGDPYGGHREITYEQGKNPNFTAVMHTSYFGSLPSITLYTPAAADEGAVADFENLTLEPESVWSGDEEGEDWYYGLGYTRSFKSGGYSFVNYCIPDYSTWIGYAYTNKTSTEYKTMADQFNSCVGHGYDNSANYVVAYPDGTMWGETLEIKVDGAPREVPGFYITNTAWTVDAILNGDGYTPGGFGVGDYFTLLIHAMDADCNVTATRRFCLADYRFETEADRYYVNDWTYVDLSALGKAAAFKFTFEGSRSNAYGLTTPTYFCIDNFGDTGTEIIKEEGTYTDGQGGVDNVATDVNHVPVIYNLQGVRVNEMTSPGIYIVDGVKIFKR